VWCNLQITICRCRLLMHVQLTELTAYLRSAVPPLDNPA
jgi:hypothetical protein